QWTTVRRLPPPSDGRDGAGPQKPEPKRGGEANARRGPVEAVANDDGPRPGPGPGRSGPVDPVWWADDGRLQPGPIRPPCSLHLGRRAYDRRRSGPTRLGCVRAVWWGGKASNLAGSLAAVMPDLL